MTSRLLCCGAVFLLGACGEERGWPGAGPGGKADQLEGEQLAEVWSHDVLSTSLAVDLRQLTAVARVRLRPAEGRASFEVGGLQELEVALVDGEPIEQRLQGGRLDLRLPVSDEPVELVFRYGLVERAELEGLHRSGVTFTWPYYCGNLFPCKPQPEEGLRFELALAGLPEGMQAIYPERIDTDAPAYMLGWAVGSYQQEPLGKTRSGTEVEVWYLSGGRDAALRGTAALRQVVEWLEERIGPYAFGARIASVAADWPGAYGGMEHHPFFHVDRWSMADAYIQAHEAAHGWFGDGVRIRCWEHFVMSEGPTSYLAARALVEVAPADTRRQQESAIWSRFRSRLEAAVREDDRSAWPESCGELDILEDKLFSSIPYMKGAFFLRALERQLGKDLLDRALARFFKERVGTASGMDDLIETIRSEADGAGAGHDLVIEELTRTWLRSTGLPDGYRELADWSNLQN